MESFTAEYRKARTLACRIVLTLFAALAIPVRLAAQEQQNIPRSGWGILSSTRTGSEDPHMFELLFAIWRKTAHNTQR